MNGLFPGIDFHETLFLNLAILISQKYSQRIKFVHFL